MPFLLATSLRRWILMSVAVPVGAAVLRKVARSIETRKGGSTAVTRGLTKAADTAQRSRRKERRRGR
ncbi:hypothetical protein [Quadrisphaera sp. INWT6]|uniref:hypothetical protein n=1 Tax=Quadrisphaera sp. INWT6 TaxID=2596917 RepID=UPI001891F907|nr:hypothetical protein [Quadrisphaera sp. INWT6]MBF5081263.1 hypothetical protein [Quadrisphaera sp. INWT6]